MASSIFERRFDHCCGFSGDGSAFDALDAAVAMLEELNIGNADPVVRLGALERLETARRRQVVIGHDLIAGLADEYQAHLGGPAHKMVADRLSITGAEERRRLRNAQQLAPTPH